MGILIIAVAGAAMMVGGILLASDYRAVAQRLQGRYDKDVARLPSGFRGTSWQRSSASWRFWGFLVACLGFILVILALSAARQSPVASPSPDVILLLLGSLAIGIAAYATIGFRRWWPELPAWARSALVGVTLVIALIVVAALLLALLHRE